jgi:hypothetical protein
VSFVPRREAYQHGGGDQLGSVALRLPELLPKSLTAPVYTMWMPAADEVTPGMTLLVFSR